MTVKRTKGDCKAPPGYSSLKGTNVVGRTRLIGAGEPVIPEEGAEAAGGPLLHPGGNPAAPPPATRALREKQQPETLREGGNKCWDEQHLHDNCGGFVNITDAGTGLDARCDRCGREWICRRGMKGWQRG
jgi:hypothetical protein